MSENTHSGAPETAGSNNTPGPESGAQFPPSQGPDVPAWHPEAQNTAGTGPSAYGAPIPATPREDVGRGTIFALAALPIGVILWMVIWGFGWMSSLVTFAAAVMAAKFYVAGAGSLSRKGVWVVAAVTTATALLSFVGGVWLDAVQYLGREPLAMVLDSEPWSLIGNGLAYNPDFVGFYMKDFLLALLFGALGCFFTLRQLFAATKAA
ncbi:hypothetical protein [Paenarthrobacter nitroguajacolicus]|uniref:hypothetical protein n=1 Tax=Paenarthrobacter nitroguajacolicus TaxID=211146 RepID=UPI00248B2BFE|nr:hypothetical protein [Paenarthrobacter nitroguajacolicus]MDI2036554.1 hypothetical protein [Paenarthrobacter nitroguajacolicus]